jgi:hypothetical protein
MKYITMFLMQSFHIVHGITQGWQESNCGRLIKQFDQLATLISTDAVSFANVVYEFRARLLFVPVLFHPYGKGILPVKEYTVCIN